MTKIIEIEKCEECPNYRMTFLCGGYCDLIKLYVKGEKTSRKCTLSDKKKISIDTSNATTLTWDEKHRAVYLRPEDIIKVDIKPAKWRVEKRESVENN